MRSSRKAVTSLVLLCAFVVVLALMVAASFGLDDTVAFAEAKPWDVLRDISRLLGVTLSMTVALCALAIPLTANVYTPKLVELFASDRRTQLVLAYFVLANATVLWTKHLVDASPQPEVYGNRVLLCMGLAVGGLVLIIPYIYYVLRFLIPRNIVDRLERSIHADIRAGVAAKNDREELIAAKRDCLEDIQYLGSMVLRSVERHDRATASSGLIALRNVFDAYQRSKVALGPDWFWAGPEDLHGLSPELKPEIARCRAIVEVAILEELAQVVPVSVGRNEMVDRIAGLVRHLGVNAGRHRHDGAREMITLYFNTYIRFTLEQKRSRAFYQFVHQYRRFAEEMLTIDADHSVRIAGFLDYYGHQAVRMGMGYLINVVAYDLAEICELAYRNGTPQREKLLDIMIDLDRDDTALIDMPGVIKAQIILAAKLFKRGEKDGYERLVIELEKVTTERLETAFAQIMAAREENFWEIADRRRHLDHVEAEIRPTIDRLHERLLGRKPDAQPLPRNRTETEIVAEAPAVPPAQSAPTRSSARTPAPASPASFGDSGIQAPSRESGRTSSEAGAGE